MRKSLLFAIILVAGLVGCGKNKSPTAPDTTVTPVGNNTPSGPPLTLNIRAKNSTEFSVVMSADDNNLKNAFEVLLPPGTPAIRADQWSGSILGLKLHVGGPSLLYNSNKLFIPGQPDTVVFPGVVYNGGMVEFSFVYQPYEPPGTPLKPYKIELSRAKPPTFTGQVCAVIPGSSEDRIRCNWVN